MIRIKNTVDDPSKAYKRQAWASRKSGPSGTYDLEPVLDGKTIRLRSHIDITDQHYEKVKSTITDWVTKGIVEVIPLDTEGKLIKQTLTVTVPEDGLTLEEWIKSGGPPESFVAVPVGEMHPFGFRVTNSAGLYKYIEDEKVKKFAPDLTTPIREITDPVAFDEVQEFKAIEPKLSVPAPETETSITIPPPAPSPPVDRKNKKKFF